MMMRIAYVTDCIARIGGVERILADKMNYLADEMGYEVHLITSSQGQHPFSFSLSEKIIYHDLDARFHVQYQYRHLRRMWVRWNIHRKFRKNLERVVGEIDPDVVIASTYCYGEDLCRLKCRARKVVESHCARSFTGMNDGVVRNAFMQRLFDWQRIRSERILERKCDVFVALTSGDAEEWKQARKVRVIPNIVPVLPPVPGVVGSARRVIAAGRLEYQKGFDLLVDAWAMVAQRYPDWSLDIFGKGSRELALKRQIEKSGLQELVRIHEPVTGIRQEYGKSDFLVLSSRYEGFGLVLVEAMQTGIPCVAFDCPYGPSDIIRDGENGLLVKNGDVEALAEAICRMIGDEELRMRCGRKAQADALQYAPEVIMAQWDKLFKELVNE